MSKIKLSELPQTATYTRMSCEDEPWFAVYCYVDDKERWASFCDERGLVLARGDRRGGAERDITRAEAIAILKERGQLDESEAQPDPIAALTRRLDDLATRLEAVEAKQGPLVVFKDSPAPPMPALPKVPECGYWTSDGGKRWVLTEPVEYRNALKGETIYYQLQNMAVIAAADHSYPNFILRELVQPGAPAGYEVVGWGRPKKGQAFIAVPRGDVQIAACDYADFRWLLRPLPKVQRWNSSPHHPLGVVPLIDTGTGPRLDRERIGIEWALKWLQSKPSAECLGDLIRHLATRLAEIREGKP